MGRLCSQDRTVILQVPITFLNYNEMKYLQEDILGLACRSKLFADQSTLLDKGNSQML